MTDNHLINTSIPISPPHPTSPSFDNNNNQDLPYENNSNSISSSLQNNIDNTLNNNNINSDFTDSFNSNQQQQQQMNNYEYNNNNVVGDSQGMNESGMNSTTPVSPPSFLSGGGATLNSSSSQSGSLHQRLNVITSKVKEFKDTRLQNTRDWMIFVGKRDKYGVPTMSNASDRVKENIIYFQTNYLILFFIFATYVIITKPLFLLLLVLLALIHIYLNYVNPELPDLQKKIGLGLQIILSVYFLLSAGSDIIWLIGATLSIVLLHAAFHVPQSTDDSQISFGNSNV